MTICPHCGKEDLLIWDDDHPELEVCPAWFARSDGPWAGCGYIWLSGHYDEPLFVPAFEGEAPRWK